MKKITFTFCIIFICITSYAQTALLGMTSEGGDGFGTIFKTDGNGNTHQMMQTFSPNIQGINPYGTLCEAPNGKLYGMTYIGGLNNTGVIFEYDTLTNTYLKKIDLSSSNGMSPYGSLLLASNGKLYGMTYNGGSNNKGVIFEYDYSSNTYSKKIDLDSANGSKPWGSLMQASNGKLYGVTSSGGANNLGVIFEYDYSSNTYTKKIDLDNANGSNPSDLIQASNGKLYGMTSVGGATNDGVIFEYDYSTNTYIKKIDLTYANGRYGGSLIQVPSGKLYGITLGGGVNNWGVLFEYDYSSNNYTKKFDFDGYASGGSPSFLMLAANGKLLGTTTSGGTTGGGGTIFEYDYATNTYANKKDLNSTTEGSSPNGLIQATNGKLYGTTSGGGIGGRMYGQGVIFEYDYSANTYTKKIDLNFAINGSYPDGSLLQASNGKIYGMTYGGGSNGLGTIFEYDHSTNIYNKKIDLSSANGMNPYGSLIQASNGKLYGMTSAGGLNGVGVIFEYDYSTNTYTKKIDLTWANGCNPDGSLLQASNGKLYGTTQGGGATSEGVIFEYDYFTNTYTKKIDLNYGGSNISAVGSLVQAANGKLYAMNRDGFCGVCYGSIFEYDYVTNVYTEKIIFSPANGTNAQGSLMLASNGKLYGMTSEGGATGEGVIFEYDNATNTYTKKFDLGGANGNYPYGSLMQASNAKLYGMTTRGGANNRGVIFEYDYSTNTYVKKLDFNGVNGSNPNYTNLIEVSLITGIHETVSNNQLSLYPNPNNGVFSIQSVNEGVYSIINELGQTIQSLKLNSTNNYSIKIENLNNGIYFIIGFDGNQLVRQKVVVTK